VGKLKYATHAEGSTSPRIEEEKKTAHLNSRAPQQQCSKKKTKINAPEGNERSATKKKKKKKRLVP